MLTNPATRNRVLEILILTGSTQSIPQVKQALADSPDYDTLVRTVAFMIKNGGPEGRAFLLSLDPSRFDAASRAYLEKVRGRWSRRRLRHTGTSCPRHLVEKKSATPKSKSA